MVGGGAKEGGGPEGAAVFLPTMLGSAMAGMIARVPTHPIDTAKARLQVRVLAGGSGLRRASV